MLHPTRRILKLANPFGKRNFCDIAIIGAGAAGSAAAVAARYEGYSVVMMEKSNRHGFFAHTPDIRNLPGFPNGISGAHLSSSLAVQLRLLGVQVNYGLPVSQLKVTKHGFTLDHDRNNKLGSFARSVILATGVEYRQLNVPGSDKFLHDGRLLYEATDSILPGIENQFIAIYGAGNSAGQAAMFYASLGARVCLIYRGEDLASSMSDYLVRRIQRSEIVLIPNTIICELSEGNHRPIRIHFSERSKSSAEASDIVVLDAHYLFVMIGADRPILPRLLGASPLELDERGYVKVEPDMSTNCPGIFAAGDITSLGAGRLVLAEGQGVTAFKSCMNYLESQ